MDVRDVVLRSVPTVGIDASLRQVADMMARVGGTAVLVVDEDGSVLGVVTEAVLAGVLDRMVEAGSMSGRADHAIAEGSVMGFAGHERDSGRAWASAELSGGVRAMTTDARLEPAATEPVPTAEEAARGEPVEGDSAKLLRITVMVHEMLEEVRHMPLDEGGRRRLRVIHEATVKELRHLLPETLRHELDAITLPLGDTATESEVRLAQIQLLGWLEGLMHGIQAALWAKVAHNLSHAQNPVVAKAAEGSDTGQYL